METYCEHCRRDCWIEDDRAGKEVVCPWCQRIFAAKEPPERMIGFASVVESLLSERERKTNHGADDTLSAPAADTVAHPLPLRGRRRKPRSTSRWAQVVVLSVLGAAALVGGSVAASRWYSSLERSASAQTSTDVPWTPDPLLVDELGSWKKFDRFAFRPPKSFTRFNVMSDPGWLPPNGHFAGLALQGEKGDKAEIFCHVVTFPPLVPMRGGLEQALGRFYGWLGYHASVVDLRRAEPEVGVLNGRKCIRSAFFCRLRRRESLRGDPREGVVYAMIDKNRQVTFYTLCDPELQEAHNLMGASLLTWREQ